MTLYELTGEYLALMSALEEGDESMVDDLLMIEDDIEHKAENYAKVIRNLEAELEALKAEEKRLMERRRIGEKSLDRIKAALKGAMEITGKTDFKSGIFKFKIVRNGGKAPLVNVPDPADLPDDLRKVEYKADSDAIREYIETTGDLSYGEIGERGTRLSIK